MLFDEHPRRLAGALSWLAEKETIFAAMKLLWLWIGRYGIPQSLYTDKKNVYVIDENTRQIAADSGLEVLTQFGRVCKQPGIEIITARSPQAKGRVERNLSVIRIVWSGNYVWQRSARLKLAISFCSRAIVKRSMRSLRWRHVRELITTAPPKATTWPASFVSKKSEA